jgi:hypothetical protein
MIPLADDFKEFVGLLNAHQVKYLVVGGYAVAFHGYPRMTGDIDFFIEATEENARRLEKVLSDFGFGSLHLTFEDFLEPDTIVQLGYPPLRIDLLTSISGVSFEQAWEQRVTVEVEGETLNFVGKETLLTNKAASGRSKDLHDFNVLRE